MLTEVLSIFVLCFVCTRGNNLLTKQLYADAYKTATPENLGRHLISQLAKNETRLLSGQCRQQVLQYAKDLFTGKLWALQMFDASAKFPPGLFRGYGANLGTFDECLDIEHEHADIGTIRGKYCLGGIRLLSVTQGSDTVQLEHETFEQPQSRLFDLKEGSIRIPWGICLPDACSARDFRILHFLLLLRFSEDNCQTKESQVSELDDGDIGAIAFLGVIGVLMILSTLYDVIVRYNGKGRGSTFLRSFSVYTNSLRIITIKEDENGLSCLYGLRALSMVFIMAGFRLAVFVLSPLQNWIYVLKWITSKNTGPMLEGIICIDTFFVISATLIVFNYLKSKEEGARFNVFVYYLSRIIRLTPALGATILIHATLMRHVGSGPIWPTIRDVLLVDNCRESWWYSLLYVQNYANPDLISMCVIQTWQLSVDMQLFLLSPLLLYPLGKAPKATIAVVCSLLFCSILSPFLASWVYKLKAVIVTNRSLEDVKNYLQHFYLPLHTRAAPWLIGFILGYLLYETKKTTRRIPIRRELLLVSVQCLWVAAMGAIVACIFIGRQLIGVEFNWFTHALHIAFIRPLWALAISWIIFACAHGYGGPINGFLSAPMFQVVSRLVYCAHLVNLTLMAILTCTTRVGLVFDEFDAVNRLWGDIAFSLFLAFVWSLAFESPFIIISKIVFRRTPENDAKVDSRANIMERSPDNTRLVEK